MEPVGRIDVLELFPEERAALLDLLSSLGEDDWHLATVCAGWSVKDLAAHVVGDDVGVVSRGRDGHRWWTAEPSTHDDLVAAINAQNDRWVRAMRRASPRVIIDLLRQSGEWALSHYRSLDLMAIGGPVTWAGPEAAPLWLDVAREYTERWAHQQQIRDATARPGLKDARHFAPVLDTYVRALPYTFREVDAAEDVTVVLDILGEAGGMWALRREGAWRLYRGEGTRADARVSLDGEAAWRLMTKGLPKDEVERAATLEGDRSLALRLLDVVAIIA